MTSQLGSKLLQKSSQSGSTVKKLLIVSNRLPVSWEDHHAPFVLDFVRALEQIGIEIAMFTPDFGELSGDIDFPVYRFRWGENPIPPEELPFWRYETRKSCRDYYKSAQATLESHLNANQYDHILALWSFPAGCLAHRVSSRTGVPYSVWSLGYDINYWGCKPLVKGNIRRALRNASFLFAGGDELCERVSSLCGRECHFMPTFRTFKHKMMSMPREKFFLYVGKLEKHKGVFDLLKAFARIKQDIWDYSLVMVGSGSQSDSMKKAIRRLDLRGKVHLLGHISIEELVNFMQRARAIIMPSHFDSIPTVFGEALQTGTPMIVTDAGDLGNLVRDNKLGFVAKRKSPRALADAMIKMMVADVDISAAAPLLIDRLSPRQAARTFVEVTSNALTR